MSENLAFEHPVSEKIVIGNWKMNGSREFCRHFARTIMLLTQSLRGVQIGLCPPYPYLDVLRPMLADSPIALGAQDLNPMPPSAMTGEVCADMLRDVGCRYVLVGHSERRLHFDESDAAIAAKFDVAVTSGLTPVLCVGETLKEREAGRTLEVVTDQVGAVLSVVGAERFAMGLIAYEPVWAIGTGMTATPGDAQLVHAAIRRRVAESLGDHRAASVAILYGGSVKPENAASLFSQPDIDGGLIGGASLNPQHFAAICQAAVPATAIDFA